MSLTRFSALAGLGTGFGVCLVSGLLLAGCGATPSGAVSEPVEISAGQQIFLDNCVGCHTGTGTPPGPNQVVLKSKKLVTKEKLLLYLRNPDNMSMPPFDSEQVSDAGVAELFDYLDGVVQRASETATP